MGFSFPKSNRLLKTKQFRTVFDVGLKKVSRHLVIFGLPADTNRLGLVVSKKVGNAVVRNRVKRILRENFRQETFGKSIPMDLVVVARHTAKAASNDELSSSLAKGIDRLERALLERKQKIDQDAKHIAEKSLADQE